MFSILGLKENLKDHGQEMPIKDPFSLSMFILYRYLSHPRRTIHAWKQYLDPHGPQKNKQLGRYEHCLVVRDKGVVDK